MKVLVCGGRDFDDRELVFRVLDRLHACRPIECIINGAARGADKLASFWGDVKGVSVYEYRANWKTYGVFGGPQRNQRMLDEGKPDLVVAFPGGRGTKDMTTRAYRAGVAVVEVNDRGETSFLARATRALTIARAASNAIPGKDV